MAIGTRAYSLTSKKYLLGGRIGSPAQIVDTLNFDQVVYVLMEFFLAGFLRIRALSVAYIDLPTAFVHAVRTSGVTSHF